VTGFQIVELLKNRMIGMARTQMQAYLAASAYDLLRMARLVLIADSTDKGSSVERERADRGPLPANPEGRVRYIPLNPPAPPTLGVHHVTTWAVRCRAASVRGDLARMGRHLPGPRYDLGSRDYLWLAFY